MKFHLAVLLLAAVVHYAYSQYYAVGYPQVDEELEDDLSYDDTAVSSIEPAALADYDSEYTLIPVQIVPVYDDAQPYYQREARGKKGKKKKKKGKKKKGWGIKHKHIWLKAPKFHAQPPIIHIHPIPKHHVHKKVHVGWGWGHGGGGGGGGYRSELAKK